MVVFKDKLLSPQGVFLGSNFISFYLFIYYFIVELKANTSISLVACFGMFSY